MKKLSITTAILTMFMFYAAAQIVMPLYKGKIPNSIPGPDEEKRDTSKANGRISLSTVYTPTLTIYQPEKGKANGTAVIICPGGGYVHLAITHEGYDVAAEFAKIGVTAFVLKYRLPSDKTMQNKEIGPLQDAQQAIKTIRQNAAKWNIDTAKIGIMGFSAGGHLASTAGTHFNMPVIENKEKTSLRPNFMILLYPVISFNDSLMHKGSRNYLLGNNPTTDKILLYSNDLQITKQTPPTMLVHAGDDKTVPVLNSIRFYEGLRKHEVPAKMIIYPAGGHGFGLINKTTTDRWFDQCKIWMADNGWIKL